jgi:hypothetical protein
MPSFGRRSRDHLYTCDSRLINVCETVIQETDFTVLCGFRGAVEQTEAFDTGRSKLRWLESKHNHQIEAAEYDPSPFEPNSLAVDVAPWHPASPHIRWQNVREFVLLAGRMLQAARSIGCELRWGGDWDMDDDLYDHNEPFDLVHLELL